MELSDRRAGLESCLTERSFVAGTKMRWDYSVSPKSKDKNGNKGMTEEKNLNCGC